MLCPKPRIRQQQPLSVFTYSFHILPQPVTLHFCPPSQCSPVYSRQRVKAHYLHSKHMYLRMCLEMESLSPLLHVIFWNDKGMWKFQKGNAPRMSKNYYCAVHFLNNLQSCVFSECHVSEHIAQNGMVMCTYSSK